LIRRYGLYSSRSRGKWLRKAHLVRLAPEGWRQDHNVQAALTIDLMDEGYQQTSVTARQSPASWGRLIAEVYESDPLIYRHCGSPMRILAAITEPQQVRKILLQLINRESPARVGRVLLNRTSSALLASNRSVFSRSATTHSLASR
jgi:hypothetical protein